MVALTAGTAAIQTASGGILTYRKHNKLALAPVEAIASMILTEPCDDTHQP